RRPQVMVTRGEGSGSPRCDIELMTMDAESAEVTKNTRIETIASTVVTVPSGRLWSISNNMASAEPESLNPMPVRSWYMDAPPKIKNQIEQTTAGTTMTTVTNSRKVRPREILAMNMPTNGVQ